MNDTQSNPGQADRAYWVDMLRRIAEPVLTALAERRLVRDMPVEQPPGGELQRWTHLEALGRTLCGIAPWLELGPGGDEEGRLRGQMCELARRAIASAVDPDSPDRMNFNPESHVLVDAGWLAHGIFRAPNELWAKLDDATRTELLRCLLGMRAITPYYNNYIAFSAIIEAALRRVGVEYDELRIDFAVRQFEDWYVGDGTYADGPDFQWDYYNSFVIQPILLDAVESAGEANPNLAAFAERVRSRARRFAEVLERLISPEGTLPPIGRSIAYRTGALQLLGQMALRQDLPAGVTPAQVRCAMTAVMHRLLDAPGTFDANGWLTIGFAGHQPGLGESYIATGSLYFAAAGLLPLGLGASAAFWSDPPADWTGRKIYAGIDAPADVSLERRSKPKN